MAKEMKRCGKCYDDLTVFQVTKISRNQNPATINVMPLRL